MENKTIELGDILYSFWGYKQANIAFYKVIKRTPKTVVLQRMNVKKVSGGHINMSSTLTCGNDPDDSEPIKRKIINETHVRIGHGEWASVWDGQPRTVTHYV